MTHPIDIIANAIRIADGNHTLGAGQLAEVAARSIYDERIVAHAAQALLNDGWRHTHEGPQGVGELSDEDLLNIAATVLRSVSGDA